MNHGTKIVLTSIAARDDLTDREVARLIGCLIGGIVGTMATPDNVYRAVRWWAEHREQIDGLADINRKMDAIHFGEKHDA